MACRECTPGESRWWGRSVEWNARGVRWWLGNAEGVVLMVWQDKNTSEVMAPAGTMTGAVVCCRDVSEQVKQAVGVLGGL